MNKQFLIFTFLIFQPLFPGTIMAQSIPGDSYSIKMAESVMNRNPGVLGSWSYDVSAVLKGFEELYSVTGDVRYYNYVKSTVDNSVNSNGDINGYDINLLSLDEVRMATDVLYLYSVTGDNRYAVAAQQVRGQLSQQPRTNSGGFWHKNIYPYQMWLDGLYMGEPFYANYAITFNQPEDLDDVVFQFVEMESRSRDGSTGLLYHGWDESGNSSWSAPPGNTSPVFWGRAMGWYAMALVDVLDYIPEANTSQRNTLISIFGRLAQAIANYQDTQTKVWWQVVDHAGASGNWMESSSSCMFVYALAKGVRMGYIDSSYLTVAQEGMQGILNQFVTEDSNGNINLSNVCTGTGVGGSLSFYYGRSKVTNDFKGTGPFILAALETDLAGGPGIVPATGVSISPATATVNSGTNIQLTATVAPSDATNKMVTWSSGNTSVATVSSTGLVTGISEGSATITVTTQDGGYIANCLITVQNGGTNSITIQENETGVLSYDGTIDNNNAGFTGDGFINTPNASGNGITYEICVPSDGTYTLAWRFANGGSADRTAEIQVDGSVAATGVSFPVGSWTTWTNTSGVSISLSSGTRQIRLEATNSDGLANIDYITVTGDNPSAGACPGAIAVTGVSVSPTSASVNVGATTQLTATVSPSDATNKTVSWGSGNTSVATVSSSGVVTGVSEGSATITVTTQDGNKTATSAITVNEVTATSVTIQENEEGFCNVDGSVDNYYQGYTGSGYANTDDASGKGIDWKIAFEDYGNKIFTFRYACTNNNPANLLIDGSTVVSNISFPSTGSWSIWKTVTVNVSIDQGTHDVRLQSTRRRGLGNIDYIQVTGGNIQAVSCTSDIPVSGISVSPSAITMNVGENSRLTATVSPSNATNKTVSWGSGNTSVATVSSSGVVTGVAAGSATITATTQDGGYIANCNVIVKSGGTTTLTIQENETGFCSVDGSVDNNNAGFTGSGFANTDNAMDKGITWSANILSEGKYSLVWRYANAGSADRTCQLMVDNSTIISSISMPNTGSWTSWDETPSLDVNLSAGTKLIRLQATNSSGLANIDYLEITGPGLSAVSCTGLKSAVEVNQIAENGLKYDVSIYPVPVNDLLYVKFNQGLTGSISIQIFDASGKLVKTDVTGEQVHVMDMSGFSKGLYIIKMSSKNINLIKYITK